MSPRRAPYTIPCRFVKRLSFSNGKRSAGIAHGIRTENARKREGENVPGTPEQEEAWDRAAEKVYRLWLQGNNRSTIARTLGVTREVVDRRLARARRNMAGEGDGLDEMRMDVESSLDELIRRSYRNLKEAETVAERNTIIRTIADLKMKKSRLLGLEQPSKLSVDMEKALELKNITVPLWGGER
jgi:hypothetical protein